MIQKILIIGITQLILSYVVGQQSHTIIAFDHGYNPDTAFVNVGDTIVLQSQGYHSITELDSVDWVNNVATDNGGFWVGFGAPVAQDWFVVNQTGKYYYNCQPHAAMGMKGVIFVDNVMGQNIEDSQILTLQINGVKHSMPFASGQNVEIYSVNGLKLHDLYVDKSSNFLSVHNLRKGIYIVVVSGSEHRYSRKVFVEY